MASVSVSTMIAVVLVFLFIIFFLMVSKSRPKPNQIDEMKETGWEIVQQIEVYLDKLAEEKEEIEQKLNEMKKIEQTILQGIKETRTPEQVNVKETVLPSSQKAGQKQQIMELYQQGYSSEEISQRLPVQKGIVEVVLNIEKMKKNA